MDIVRAVEIVAVDSDATDVVFVERFLQSFTHLRTLLEVRPLPFHIDAGLDRLQPLPILRVLHQDSLIFFQSAHQVQ